MALGKYPEIVTRIEPSHKAFVGQHSGKHYETVNGADAVATAPIRGLERVVTFLRVSGSKMVMVITS